MADIMHKTSRLMAAVLLGCLLAGCGGQLLSHREIVRAVFFTAQDAGFTVKLLTSDQQSEDSAACKTFTGSGATCAAAWNAAAQTMNGQPFYGLMDLAVLPAGHHIHVEPGADGIGQKVILPLFIFAQIERAERGRV